MCLKECFELKYLFFTKIFFILNAKIEENFGVVGGLIWVGMIWWKSRKVYIRQWVYLISRVEVAVEIGRVFAVNQVLRSCIFDLILVQFFCCCCCFSFDVPFFLISSFFFVCVCFCQVIYKHVQCSEISWDFPPIHWKYSLKKKKEKKDTLISLA